MDMSEEELLQRTYALEVENNRLLKKIRRSAWIGFLFKIAFLALTIGLPIWVYFTFLQPVVGQANQTYEQMKGMGAQMGITFPSFDFLKQSSQ